jgi:hypothetical protein
MIPKLIQNCRKALRALLAGTTPMTDNKLKMAVFIETALFTSLVKGYLLDEDYAALQRHIMENPKIGPMIAGSGGIRKVRWSRPGMGKSGGVSVIYYWLEIKAQIFMLTIYGKSEKANIDKKTLTKISKQLESMK